MLGRVSKVVIGMAAQISKLQYLKALVLFIWLFVPTFSQTFLSCENSSPDASGYHCNRNSVEKCGTFAILRTNSYFSSLFNLSFYLGIDRLAIAEANGFSARTEFLPKDQPLLIPIDCKCNGGLFQAELTKTTTKGESFDGIAESLEGLTTCKAIQEKNPGISPRNLDDKVRLLIPLRCACPSSEAASPSKLLLSYPVNQVAAAFLLIQLKKRKQTSCSISKGQDLELQQLSQSVRTTSEKKVSFDGSHQEALDNQISSNIKAHHKALLETYTIEELRKATENFHSSNHIGGSVYNGRLNGKNLAVKRIQPEIIPKIDFGFFIDAIHHHPNILRLLGTCLNEGSDSFLVFEYARNGSLKDWLHGGLAIKNQFIASCYCFLTWSQRLKICLDVAMALQYMHQVMDPVYVHRNVKTRNIFLDEEFNAKLGNFGMARCAENDTAEDPNLYSTNPASWSLGYLAPEYIHQGIISPSLDIFAYGVVLLEVLSGQTPISRPNEKGGGSIWLAEKIKPILESENGGQELRDWMDNALGENYSFDAALSMANLARVCIEEEPSLRPSVEEIIEKISRLINEDSQDQGEHNLMTESSSKPLVKAAATTVHGSRDTL
ncbi:protein LYK2 isoform X2 [Ziziphus jujuba]|uniref:Protein LYK2 isoform X2 n=1 Tax=Ziziphus jujuba TaxID=326968 RepID=A0ABM4AHT1_ZIZJJ|nr:protein LYK2 isoform X2 [Ziziphus jujuba]